MISKLLETAILGLQAVADPTGTTTNTTVTPADQAAIDAANQAAADAAAAAQAAADAAAAQNQAALDSVAYYGSLAVQIAAFVYLGLGLAYCFFGAKFVKYFISLLSGLLVAGIPFVFVGINQVSTGLTIASFSIFGLVSYGCLKLEKIHAAILGIGVGTYVGSVGWALFLSYFTAPYTKFIVEAIAAVILGYYGFHHAKKFLVHATAFLGANMIATAITLFTADAAGLYGNIGIQVACIIIFGSAGHHAQKKMGFEKYHEGHGEHVANKGDFIEHQEAKIH